MLAYETDDTTLSDTLQGENLFCINRVLPYTADFEKYGWITITSRCGNLQSQYTTSVRKMFFVQKDHLGSTIALTDSSGSVAQEYTYDVYGSPYISSGTGYIAMQDFTGNLHGNTRLFTGREYDGEIGLYYLRARYYDANTGRFISRDPIWQTDDINLYGYVGNSPMMGTDPTGRVKALLRSYRNFTQNELANSPNLMDQASAWTSDFILGQPIDYITGFNDRSSWDNTVEWGTTIALMLPWGKWVKAGWMLLEEATISWTAHGGKHISNAKILWNDIIESTKNGPAKYLPKTDIENLERKVWETGTQVTNWKNWKVAEFESMIWASEWKISNWMRVENSANTIHGHPITKQEYLKLTR